MGKTSTKKKKASDNTVLCTSASGPSGKNCPSETGLPQKSLTNRVRYYLAGSVSFVTFLVYLSSLHNDFVNWDDGLYVYDNPNIRFLNIPFFRWAFFDFYASNWHPLTWISHAVDYAFWGLNPLGHHLTNNMLHAANTFVVVVLVTRLLEIWKENATANSQAVFLNGPAVLITSATTGLLFGLHPVHVESVAWIAERKDLLCAFFFLFSIMSYANYVSDIGPETNQNIKSRFVNRKYLFSAGFFILALLSKPMAVTLPAVLLLLDWYPFKRIRSLKLLPSVFAEKIPLFALSLVSSVLTIKAQAAGGSVSMGAAALSTRVYVAGRAIIVYIWKMLLPYNLVPFYPYPQDRTLFSVEHLSLVILVLGITAACVVLAKRHKVFLSVWGYYLLTLMPVLGIVQVGSQSMADRYTYLPSLGLFILIGIVVAWVSGKMNTLQKGALTAKSFAVAAAIVVLGSMTFLTYKQIQIWKDGFALWSYVTEREPGQIPVAYNNLGNAYLDRNMPEQAVEQFLIAIKLDPYSAEAYNNLGNTYQLLNMPDRAVEQYITAIKMRPDYAETHNNLGIVYKSLNMPDKAIEQFLIAVQLRPDYANAYNNLGNIYQVLNMPDKAIQVYLTVIKLDPDSAEAHFNLGLVYYRSGDKEKARRELSAGLSLKPDDQQARQLLGQVSN
ncbi:MAG: tetratricopeptide repeat protein [Nitrospirae bacterium]|nr:tetratricopeptide repeat protein [Nitrospirota bacterium]